ncbi:hypothetical protein FisN_12Lh116 [Fistulifera solaris]|jgi:serine/threonine protein kinase|uniref:Protein kinase domain-containing protein n=1 Tax=Fistulifera solaris TaxID=1519565 RepID=A0A1Z5JMV0_FISSO|nr:hypothetical protein FisN_12Lh116 [Fistulifera solaris]|eukprot:GAX15182.1 hypothetical protein FisN_12Lh116 [Fistulifera solaris]
MRSQEWWKRQLVQRSTAPLKEHMERMRAESPFLREHPPRLLAKFDRSEIVTGRVLGKGGFSVVYEVLGFDLDSFIARSLTPEERKLREVYARNVLDPKTKRSRYVIKYLRPETVRHAFREAANDLVLEGEFLSRLQHENIITLHGLPINGVDAWQDGLHDGYFLILDRLTETLDHCLHNKISKAPTARKKMEYALDLASAIDYLHSNGIVFRDLKPSNLGFSSTGRIQLYDFGLARELPGDGDDVYEMSGVGTRRYMAPEVIRERRYNAKVDVYSWSMVVWQLFTHCKPYSLYSPVDHARHVCIGGERPPLGKGLDIHGDLKASLGLSPFLKDLLADCWVESIRERCSMSDVRRRMQCELARMNGSFFYTEATPEGIEVTISFDLASSRHSDREEDNNTVSLTAGESFDETQSSLSLGHLVVKESVSDTGGCYPVLKSVLSGSTCSMSSLSLADSMLATHIL